jgi:hypothetical protein
MTQHTQGRLKLSERGHIYSENLELVAVTQPARTTEANARRLVACWNACDGYDTDALESEDLMTLFQCRTISRLMDAKAQRDELLEALKAMVEVAELTIGWLPTPANADGPLIQARAAITKVEGGK